MGNARSKGSDAYFENKKLSDNPYTLGDVKYLLWYEGYMEAKDEFLDSIHGKEFPSGDLDHRSWS